MATQKNKYTSIDLSKYDAGYQASQDVLQAEQNKINAENALAGLGKFQYSNQAAYDQALDAINNRKKFSYDLNADALYQQYKDNYITQGKQASIDVMGQAAAMTGGYGNSYAATVGNQTYQGYLTQLNNIAPELYKLALDKYNSEGNDLNNRLNVLAADRQLASSEWTNEYNRLAADRDYYSSDYDAAYGRDYTAWNDNRTYDTSQYWNEYNAGYQAEQDAIAQQRWEKEFKLAQDQFNYQKSQKSGSGNGNGNGTGDASIPSGVEEKCKGFTDNDDLAAYLDGLESSGVISQSQSDSLYAVYQNSSQKQSSLANRTWKVTNKGGWNVGWGLDNNAELTDQYGNTFTAKELKKQLMANGMSEDEANNFFRKFGADVYSDNPLW